MTALRLVVCGLGHGPKHRAWKSASVEQVIGKSTVARVCKDVAARYAAWCERDLAMHDLVYCYLDAIYLKLRPTAGVGKNRVTSRKRRRRGRG
ncbi:MAG: transposase [Actinobacteria bacterium]|nr:transposase [Actinomycetota bacterium]